MNWDEIKVAYHVAREGTVSGAANALGVHHATVIRHIDALEERLGVKLFQRHARGYTPTEAGSDMLRVAQATDDQFSQLEGRIKGQGDTVSGELVVTTLSGLSHLIVPVISSFQESYPDLMVRYLTGERVFRLEYGEAHVAIRAGDPPQEPDNVAQKFYDEKIALYASGTYITQHGQPKTPKDYASHRFVGAEGSSARAPFARWMSDHIPASAVVFRSGDIMAQRQAVIDGVGMGFLPELAAPDDMIQIAPPRAEWSVPIWLVTHMDLHRTTKVQAFLNHLKAQAKTWG